MIERSRLPDYGLLLLLAALWGSSYPLIKIALETIPPVSLMALRVAIAAIVLVTVVRLRNEALPRGWRAWQALLPQAFFISIGAWTLLAWGQQFVDSGLAGVLNSTSPIFVFFITLIWTRHESTSLTRFAGALLGLLGVALILGVDVLSGTQAQLVPQLAILAGALLYACSAIYGKRFDEQPAVTTAAGAMIWAVAFLCPGALILDEPWSLDASLRSTLAALALALFSTAAALFIYFRLLKTLGSLGVASQSYLRSLVAVGIGLLLLGESMTAGLALGILAIVTGMVMINIRPGERA